MESTLAADALSRPFDVGKVSSVQPRRRLARRGAAERHLDERRHQPPPPSFWAPSLDSSRSAVMESATAPLTDPRGACEGSRATSADASLTCCCIARASGATATAAVATAAAATPWWQRLLERYDFLHSPFLQCLATCSGVELRVAVQ